MGKEDFINGVVVDKHMRYLSLVLKCLDQSWYE